MNSGKTIRGRPAGAGGRRSGSVAEGARFLILLFVLALILRTFIVAPFSIPSGSMLPRLMIGDYLFVAKWPYGYSRYSFPFRLARFDGRLLARRPERGDVVVFHYPGGDVDYVKRVIGLPGDTVQMKSGTVWLNRKPLVQTRIADYLMPVTPNSPCRAVDPDAARTLQGDDGRPLCAYARYRETLPDGRSYEVLDQVRGPGDESPELRVPQGHYFVMGDNRDDSEDSRFPLSIGGVGMLPEDNLIGRALITFFSVDGSAAWRKPADWLRAVRWERIGRAF